MAHLHIIYRISNKINNKFYIGYHKTKNINDEYYGSGHLIKKAIKKYGIENFAKEILFIYTNEKEAFLKEKELVTKEVINSGLCYNLNVGGHGGFEAIRRQGKNNSCLNRKIIHNPETNQTKKVLEKDINNFLNSGWVRGFSKLHKERLSLGGKLKIQSEKQRKKNSEAKKDAVIMYNKTLNKRKFVKNVFIDEFKKNGWELYSVNFKRVFNT